MNEREGKTIDDVACEEIFFTNENFFSYFRLRWTNGHKNRLTDGQRGMDSEHMDGQKDGHKEMDKQT